MSFPCSHKKHPDLYSPEEIYFFLNQDFYPPPPFDTYNLSIPCDLKLEPSLKAQFEFHSKVTHRNHLDNTSYSNPYSLFSFRGEKESDTGRVNKRRPYSICSFKGEKEFGSRIVNKRRPYSLFSFKGEKGDSNGIRPTSQKKILKASVIIPVYGDAKELILTLKHLSRQDCNKAGLYQKSLDEKVLHGENEAGLYQKSLDEKVLHGENEAGLYQKSLDEKVLHEENELSQKVYSKTEFEVIVIDDGSPTDISSQLKDLDFLKEMNFKFLSLPRIKARTSSKDHRFRAGIARNLGAREAKGEYLFFLDADILVPPSYISSSLKELKKHPVIQHPRYHLKFSAPVEYQKIIKAQHCFVRGQSYWEDFYESSQDWSKRSLPWKYISTNTLCLRSDLFKQAGAFRKNYTCYGFEDTDLGYRLYQAGIPFYLHKLNTYHLYRDSEYLGREKLKQELLGLSVLTFFHNTHCLSAYKEFVHLIKQTAFKS